MVIITMYLFIFILNRDQSEAIRRPFLITVHQKERYILAPCNMLHKYMILVYYHVNQQLRAIDLRIGCSILSALYDCFCFFISPHYRLTISPHYRLIISPHCRLTILPHCRLTISSHYRLTISPHYQLTISPHYQLTISPHCRLTIFL